MRLHSSIVHDSLSGVDEIRPSHQFSGRGPTRPPSESLKLSYVAAISLLTTIALGFVVFASPRSSFGVWDDLAFLVAALVFLWSVVRLLGARASDTANAAQILEDDELLERAAADPDPLGARRDSGAD